MLIDVWRDRADRDAPDAVGAFGEGGLRGEHSQNTVTFDAFGARTRKVTRPSAVTSGADRRRLRGCCACTAAVNGSSMSSARSFISPLRINGVGYHRMAKMSEAPVARRLLPARLSITGVGGRRVLHRRRWMDARPDQDFVAAAGQAAPYRGRRGRCGTSGRTPRADREADGRWLQRWAARVLRLRSLAVLLALYLGIHYGSFAAAGSDSYGYLSQARLWLGGVRGWSSRSCRIFLAAQEWVFSPLGAVIFTGWDDRPDMPSGLPMLMAVFSVFGDSGPFYVVPVLGALMLWLTYVLGRDATGSRTVGALATVLLLASPVFLTLLVPMSDIPAAAGGPWLR